MEDVDLPERKCVRAPPADENATDPLECKSLSTAAVKEELTGGNENPSRGRQVVSVAGSATTVAAPKRETVDVGNECRIHGLAGRPSESAIQLDSMYLYMNIPGGFNDSACTLCARTTAEVKGESADVITRPVSGASKDVSTDIDDLPGQRMTLRDVQAQKLADDRSLVLQEMGNELENLIGPTSQQNQRLIVNCPQRAVTNAEVTRITDVHLCNGSPIVDEVKRKQATGTSESATGRKPDPLASANEAGDCVPPPSSGPPIAESVAAAENLASDVEIPAVECVDVSLESGAQAGILENNSGEAEYNLDPLALNFMNPKSLIKYVPKFRKKGEVKLSDNQKAQSNTNEPRNWTLRDVQAQKLADDRSLVLQEKGNELENLIGPTSQQNQRLIVDCPQRAVTNAEVTRVTDVHLCNSSLIVDGVKRKRATGRSVLPTGRKPDPLLSANGAGACVPLPSVGLPIAEPVAENLVSDVVILAVERVDASLDASPAHRRRESRAQAGILENNSGEAEDNLDPLALNLMNPKTLIKYVPKFRKKGEEKLSDKQEVQSNTYEKQCTMCAATFLDTHLWSEHILTHCSFFCCTDCNETFTEQSELEEHLKTHHILPEKEVKRQTIGFICIRCKYHFSSVDALNKHMLACFQCTVCRMTFDTVQKLKNHMSVALYHSEGHLLHCRCGHVSTSSSVHGKHVRSCAAAEHYCSMCWETFPTLLALAGHYALLHGSKRFTFLKSFKCPTCAKQYLHENELLAHIAIHEGERRYLCEKCGKSYPDGSSYWKVHFARCQSTNEPFTCSLCGKKMWDKKVLAYHMRRHMGVKNFACKVCLTTYYTAQQLAHHKKGIHNRPALPCSICGEAFQMMSLHNKHMCQVHKPTKTFRCSDCCQLFHNKLTLIAHLQSVKCKKRWLCDTCDHVHPTRDILQRHMRIHFGPKSCCAVCGKTFRGRTSLSRHMLLHAKERPYPCKLCGKQYAQHGNIKYHMQAAHGISELWKCAACSVEFSTPKKLGAHYCVGGPVLPSKT